MSTHMDRYKQLFDKALGSADAWTDVPVTEFSEDVARMMEEQGVSRAELARRLRTSRAYVTRMLGGNANFTLQTMTKVAMALGAAVHVHLAPQAATVHWRDEHHEPDTAGEPDLSEGHKASADSGGKYIAGRA